MLEINGLKKRYGDFTLDCTMSVEAGRITGLVGQNGAGKSTIFKSVLGLIGTDGGSIRVFEKEAEDLTVSDRRKIGVVLADSGFSGYLTVRDIIPVLANLYADFDRAYFEKQVQRFELPLRKKIKEFSTGMKAKLKVLTAASVNAKLLLLDEPTVGLDVIARDELLEILRDFMEKDENRAILISSHISGDLESLCDDLYMIHAGQIVLHEDTDVLLSEYGLLKVDEKQYAGLDRQYLMRVRKEPYGYSCLTNQKRYYMENYPGIAVETGSIDETIAMMVRGQEA